MKRFIFITTLIVVSFAFGIFVGSRSVSAAIFDRNLDGYITTQKSSVQSAEESLRALMNTSERPKQIHFAQDVREDLAESAIFRSQESADDLYSIDQIVDNYRYPKKYEEPQVKKSKAKVRVVNNTSEESVANLDSSATLNLNPAKAKSPINVKIYQEPEVRSHGQEREAYEFLHSGNPEAAIAIYKRLMLGKKYDRDVFFGLGTAYQLAGQPIEAMKMYKMILHRNARDVDAINNAIAILSESQGLSAIDSIKSLDILIGNSPMLAAQIGTIYSSKGLHDQAVKYLKMAVDEDQANPLYSYNLAVTYESSGDVIAALEQYELALKKSQNSPKILLDVGAVAKRIAILTTAMEAVEEKISTPEKQNEKSQDGKKKATEVKKEAKKHSLKNLLI